MLVGMLRVGLLAGALVTLITHPLPERGRLFSRPICAARGLYSRLGRCQPEPASARCGPRVPNVRRWASPHRHLA